MKVISISALYEITKGRITNYILNHPNTKQDDLDNIFSNTVRKVIEEYSNKGYTITDESKGDETPYENKVNMVYNLLLDLNGARDLGIWHKYIKNTKDSDYIYKGLSGYISSALWNNCDAHNIMVKLNQDKKLTELFYELL